MTRKPCLLGKIPNSLRTLSAASSCASVPDALTAVPAKEKTPVQHEHYTHTAPDFPSSTILSIFFFLPHFLLMQLLFFFCSSSFRISCTIFCATSQPCISDLVLRYSAYDACGNGSAVVLSKCNSFPFFCVGRNACIWRFCHTHHVTWLCIQRTFYNDCNL